MADRPILFSAPMVRALLAGTKTQTRRALKPQPVCHVGAVPSFSWGRYGGLYPDDWFGYGSEIDGALPYRPGDRLWVREAYSGPYYFTDIAPRHWKPTVPIWYWTDGNPEDGDWTKPKPGIHMPRWASRLTLTVTDVRVRRLHDISEEDARAEGVECDSDGWRDYLMPATQCCASATDSYRTLWDSINGAGSWDANPWVAAYTFTIERRDIDSQGGQPDV